MGHAANTDAGRLTEWPAGWMRLCASADLRRGPRTVAALGRELVAFRTAAGGVGVLSARCAHFGADLGGGEVVGDRLRCPFHHWEFDAAGLCRRIPAQADIPATARQRAFPAAEAGGSVYFFNGEPPGPPPFFDGLSPADLTLAPPFTLALDCPWYLVGANGIDVQHFRTTHDRELVGGPEVSHPSPGRHDSVCRFRVVGRTWRDALTRAFAGPEVGMRVADHAGTMFFVRAEFRRTTSFGMVALLPVTASHTRVTVSVGVRRGVWPADALASRVRRYFIRRFLEPDVARSAGTRLDPSRLIVADRLLTDYFTWLRGLHGPAAVP